jgi:hypothetical protein
VHLRGMKQQRDQSAHAATEAQGARRRKAFEASAERFEGITAMLKSSDAAGMTHSALESRLHAEGMDLLRQLLQDHLDLRSEREPRLPSVVGEDGQERTHDRTGRSTKLMSIFGPVEIRRRSYEGRGLSLLSPADAVLNLPAERYSHGLQRHTAVEVSKGSFDAAVETIDTMTGGHVPKRQTEEIARKASKDFDAFYATREGLPPGPEATILVTTFDGKGVVVRPQDLREATRKKAEKARKKEPPVLGKGPSPGEKKQRKRMAAVAAVYTIAPFVRTAEDIIKDLEPVKAIEKQPRPQPENKRVWASLREPPEAVIAEAFEEAHRRDPLNRLRRVALVDGNDDQICLLLAAQELSGTDLTIIVDIIHVAGYLWKAALALHGSGNTQRAAAADWAKERLRRILRGESSDVAAGMRRSATKRRLPRERRKAIDKCAGYLLKYKAFLRYNEYLADGLPIATGVIEGACRHLVKDRMDVPGQWSLDGAEAVLKLRAIRSSGDFNAYWSYHERKEHERNHLALYQGGRVPETQPAPQNRGHLRVVNTG